MLLQVTEAVSPGSLRGASGGYGARALRLAPHLRPFRRGLRASSQLPQAGTTGRRDEAARSVSV